MTCLVCGVEQPVGHVRVFDDNHRDNQVGVVCSRHTLKEVIHHKNDRLSVAVFYDLTPDERPL